MSSNPKSKDPNVFTGLKPTFTQSRLFFTSENKLKIRLSYLDNSTTLFQRLFSPRKKKYNLSAAQ